jgi:hypothetical protein
VRLARRVRRGDWRSADGSSASRRVIGLGLDARLGDTERVRWPCVAEASGRAAGGLSPLLALWGSYGERKAVHGPPEAGLPERHRVLVFGPGPERRSGAPLRLRHAP